MNIVEIFFCTVDTDAEYAAVDEIINTLKKGLYPLLDTILFLFTHGHICKNFAQAN